MMRDLYNALPDDRPITSISVVEELAGCPVNYTAVSKTHDQDIDADLYKDGFFRRVTRYLCHSKTEGYMGYIVENILIINDRDCRPTGFTIIEQTQDTGQKAFKKKQLCYKAVPRHMASQSVTDIIILSRSKVAPEGFTLVGEMNGLCICYKPGPVPPAPTPNKSSAQPSSSPLPYGVNPAGGVSSSTGGNGALYPGLSPSRPAPQPPGGPLPGPLSPPPPLPPRNIGAPYNSPSHASRDTSTLYGPPQSALFGVPFTLNQKYVKPSQNGSSSNIPNPGKKSRQQVEDEYYYSFTLEQDVLQRPTS